MMLGVDVASYQAGIDFGPLPADFCMIKATGGVGYVNPACDAQYRSAKAAGTRKALYHFSHEAGYGGTPEAEAEFFYSQTRGYWDGGAFPILDHEATDIEFDVGWALRFLQHMELLSGLKPWLYINDNQAEHADWTPVTNAGYKIWLAFYPQNYTGQATYNYKMVNGYGPETMSPPMGSLPPASVVCWQFADAMHLTGWGGGVDASIFYGTGADWDSYCGAGVTAQGTVTTGGSSFMTYTPEQEQLILDKIIYMSGPDFKRDIWQGTTQEEKDARAAFVQNEVLAAGIDWYGYDGKIQTTGRKYTSLAITAGFADTMAQGIKDAISGAVSAAVVANIPKAVADAIAAHPQAAQIDSAALAQAIATNLATRLQA